MDYKEEIKKLQQQLKEKDQEIKRLNKMIDTLPAHDEELTKQVCEKIKNIVLRCAKYKGFDYIEFKKLLDQIQRG